MKKLQRKSISWLCILSLMAAYFLAVPLNTKAAEPTAYKELTFRDWGFGEEGTVTEPISSTETPIATWDNVALSGHLKYKETPVYANESIYIGSDSTQEVGIRLKYSKKSTGDGYQLALANVGNDTPILRVATEGPEIDFRMTITPAATDKYMLEVTVGEESESVEVAKSAFPLKKIQMWVQKGETYDYKSTPETTRGYREYTFKDWGFDETGIVMETISSTISPITTWDYVAFSGSMAYDTTAKYDHNVIGIGSHPTTGKCLRMQYSVEGQYVDVLDGSSQRVMRFYNVDRKFDFRVTFTPTGTDSYNVVVTIDNQKMSTSVQKTQLNTSITLYQGKTTRYSYESTLIESTGYREFTFRDWGFGEEGTVTAIKDSTNTPITSWDYVAFSGHVKFIDVTNFWNQCIAFGANKTSKGLGLRYASASGACLDIGYSTTTSDEQGRIKLTPRLATNNTEFDFRITFTPIENDTYRVDATAGTVSESYEIQKSALSLKTMQLFVQGGSKFEYKSTPELTEYTELTFRDWGFHTESFTKQSWNTATPITTWNNVAVRGTLKFAEVGSTIVIGADQQSSSWKGIKLEYYLDGTNKLWFGKNGTSKAKAISGIEVNKEYDFRITFHETDAGIEVELAINNKTHKLTVDSLAGFDIVVAPPESQQPMMLKSTTVIKEMDDEIYNIEKEPYVLTAASSVSIALIENDDIQDFVEKQIGDTLNESGEYIVKTNSNGVLSARQVSLYVLGDVDLDATTDEAEAGITLDADDVATLKSMLTGGKSSQAQKKAADLNNDGEIDNTDLKLLQDIVGEPNRRNDVLKKYYPDALSFEYLGGNDVMPIVGYNGPNEAHLTDEVFDDIKNTGINIIGYSTIEKYGNPNAVLKQLELAEEKGLGVFVRDATINYLTTDGKDTVLSQKNYTDKEVAEFRGDYSYFNSYLGNFVMDEPTVPGKGHKDYQISDTHIRNYEYYTTVSKQLNKHANTVGYLNNAAATWFSGWENIGKNVIEEYKDIIETITTSTNAKVLSFDRYMKDLETIQSCKKYMVNLDVIRSQALESEIPFWSFVQAGGNFDGKDSSTIPTEAELYWEVNMNLAFGAKGIQYYTLVQGDNKEDLTSSGILDANYNKNQTTNRAWYDYVTNANQQITAVDEILMKATNKGVITTGGYATSNTENVGENFLFSNYTLDAVIDNYSDIKSSDGIQRVESISGNSNNKYGVLAGVFDYQGKVALYVVNWDTTASQTITVDFNGDNAYNYRVLSAEEDVNGYGTSYSAEVKPGGAYLIVIEEEELPTTTQEFANIVDIAKFKATDGSYTAPELDGYVFAGWYKNATVAASDYSDYYVKNESDKMPGTASQEEKDTVITDLSKHEGALWARYVDESILTVKAQLSSDTTPDQTTPTKMRLVTTVNSLNYSNVGFNIATKNNTKGTDVISTTVFSEILAKDTNLSYSHTPDVFDPHSKYFNTLTLINLKVKDDEGNDYTKTEYIVKPFWTTPDGTRVYGTPRVLSVAMGLEAMAKK